MISAMVILEPEDGSEILVSPDLWVCNQFDVWLICCHCMLMHNSWLSEITVKTSRRMRTWRQRLIWSWLWAARTPAVSGLNASINQSNNQIINQSINQSINQQLTWGLRIYMVPEPIALKIIDIRSNFVYIYHKHYPVILNIVVETFIYSNVLIQSTGDDDLLQELYSDAEVTKQIISDWLVSWDAIIYIPPLFISTLWLFRRTGKPM